MKEPCLLNKDPTCWQFYCSPEVLLPARYAGEVQRLHGVEGLSTIARYTAEDLGPCYTWRFSTRSLPCLSALGCLLSRSVHVQLCRRRIMSPWMFSVLCLVSTIPLPFFRCRFSVPVSRFRTLLPLPLPLRIFLLFTTVTERNFLT